MTKPCTKPSGTLIGLTRAALFAVVLSPLTLAAPASAILPTEAPKVAPTQPEPDLGFQLELTSREVWREFIDHHGDWVILWDENTGLPRRATSQGFQLLAPEPTNEQVVAATGDFIGQNHRLFGLHQDQTELIYAQKAQKHWVVLYRQHVNGIPVENSQISFFVNQEGKLAMFQTRGIVQDLTLENELLLGANHAKSIFREAMLGAGLPPELHSTDDDPELTILPDSDNFPRLTWKLGILTPQDPYHFVGHVDVRTGEILRWSNEVFTVNVVGTVDAQGHQSHANSSIVTQETPEIRVQVQGGNSAFADSNGNFVVNHGGTGNVNVSVTVEGRWTTVNNTAGGEVSRTQSFTPGVSSNIRLNPSDTSEFTVAQIDAFIHMTRVHEFMKRVLPSSTIFDRSVPANVNINSSCNAFWNGSSTNYYRLAGSCNNTSFDSVIYHEYGHAADAFAGGIIDGGLSEGFGDILSYYITEDPLIGRAFFRSGGGIRNADNGRTWPANECNGEVHCKGEVWAGFAYIVRESLIATLGSGPGIDAAEQAVIPTFIGNPRDIPDGAVQTFIFDDDNGDLSDGTPNFTVLAGAASIKNLPIPAPPTITNITPTEVGRCSANQMIIQGAFFLDNGTEVRVGNIEANIVDVNAQAGRLRIDLPDLPDGVYDVTVATPFGVALMPNVFSVTDNPEVVATGAFYIGSGANLDVCGDADADYFVAASIQSGNEVFEGAQLDLGHRLFILANSFSGSDDPLDGSGNASIHFQIPNNQNLIFLSPKFQVAIRDGSPGGWAVSNVTTVTIFP